MAGPLFSARAGASTLTDHLDRHRRDRPEQVFVHFIVRGEVPETLTFGALAEGAAQYARLYLERGLARGDIVLIMLNHTPEQYLAFAGAVLAGLIPSFMPFPSSKQDPQLFWEAHRKLVARLGNAALITYRENRTSLADNLAEPTFQVLTPEDRRGHAADWLAANADAEDTALLQHTSGTTGLKKGIALSHRAVLNQIEHYAAALRIGAGASIASWLPLYHDMGLVCCFLLPLVLGLPVVAIDPFEWIVRPGILFTMIERFRSTHVWMPNFAFRHLARHEASLMHHDLASVEAFINCSEPCRAETFAEFARCFGGAGVRSTALQVCYAAAETTFAVTQTRHGEAARVVHVDERRLDREGVAVPLDGGASAGAQGVPARTLLSCGVPLDGVSLRVLDETGLPLPEGRVGEIAIAGDALFSGYFRQPDETAQRLVVDAGIRWYRSRDLGFLLDGELFVLGRTDDMVISYGKNYFMHDVEHVCAGLADLRPGRSVAFGVYNPRSATQDLVIVAELARAEPDERTTQATAQAVKRELRRRIASQLMGDVQVIELVAPGWLIKTTSGKISRTENRAKYLKQHQERVT